MLNNLMPWVQAVALGHRPVLNVYGEQAGLRGEGLAGGGARSSAAMRFLN